MTGDKQTQKSGNNSQMIQANNIVINQGITEKRAREICTEMYELNKKELTQEAFACAEERVQKFENSLMDKILKIEGAINLFSDPAFQLLLSSAHRAAVASEREQDYDRLSELLVCHIKEGKSRKTRAGISKAVEIVDKIDNDALCALTVVYTIQRFIPLAATSKQGIITLAGLFQKLMYMELPSDDGWIEHLEILDAVRIQYFSGFSSLESDLARILSGYTCAGIKKDSDEYMKAIDLLRSIGLNSSFLVNNDFMPEYVKIPVVNKENIKNSEIIKQVSYYGQILTIPKSLSEAEIYVFKSIFDLYTKDNSVNNKSLDAFMKEYDQYQSLKKLHIWRNKLCSLPYIFNITQIGMVLAHTNARRCDSNLPELPLTM